MSMMEPRQITKSSTVSEVLQRHPGTSQVFLEKRTLCLGCYMARFCSLRDVANVYSLDTETFVHEMQQAAINKTFQNFKEEDSNWDKSHPIR